MPQDNYVSPTIVASGTTFAQLQAGGLSAMVDKFIGTNVALSAKAAPTVSATGGGASGGLLAAATYTFRFTEVTGFGEGPVSATSSATVVGATNIPRVTMAALSAGASSRNLYIATGGAEVLYATGITTTTYDCAVAVASAADPAVTAPPTVDTSPATGAQEYLGQGRSKQFQRTWDAAARNLHNFLQGDPVNLNEVKLRHAKFAAVLKTLVAAMDEAGVLIAANHGTLTSVTNSAGNRVPRRTFP